MSDHQCGCTPADDSTPASQIGLPPDVDLHKMIQAATSVAAVARFEYLTNMCNLLVQYGYQRGRADGYAEAITQHAGAKAKPCRCSRTYGADRPATLAERLSPEAGMRIPLRSTLGD